MKKKAPQNILLLGVGYGDVNYFFYLFFLVVGDVAKALFCCFDLYCVSRVCNFLHFIFVREGVVFA